MFFTKYYSHIYILARAILISSDILASTITDFNDLDNVKITKLLKNNTDFYNIIEHPIYKGERFNQQLNIVKNTGKTTIVKAPAGFGKTITGILWNLKSDKKLIWVCPRNIIVETLYDSIVEEVKKLNINLSIEQFITGERQRCTDDTVEEFNSDIVITNIDNFLRPINKNLSKSVDICTRDVIFDEYHEFITDSSLFSGFINILKIRNLLLKNAKTLLLSATPSLVHFLWENDNIKTTILPNASEH